MSPTLALLGQMVGTTDSIINAGLGFGLGVIFLFITLICTALALFAFWIWMLIDCAQAPDDPANNRAAWILILVFTHWLGAVLYFFIVRQPRTGRARATAPYSPPPFAPPPRAE